MSVYLDKTLLLCKETNKSKNIENVIHFKNKNIISQRLYKDTKVLQVYVIKKD